MNSKNDFLKQAKYSEIICRLIYEYNLTSEIKIIFTTFAIYNMELGFKGTAQKYNFFDDLVKEISFGISNNFDDFMLIFDCINLLKKTSHINENNGVILKLKEPQISNTNIVLNSKMFEKILSEIEKVSDKTLISEVIKNV